MKDILQFMAQEGTPVDNYAAPDVAAVTRAALLVLDKNSIYAALHNTARSRNKTCGERNKQPKDSKNVRKVHWQRSDTAWR